MKDIFELKQIDKLYNDKVPFTRTTDTSFHFSGLFFVELLGEIIFIGEGIYTDNKMNPSEEIHLFKRIHQYFTLSNSGVNKALQIFLLSQANATSQKAFDEFCRENVSIYYLDLTNIAETKNDLIFIKSYFIVKMNPLLNASKKLLSSTKKPIRLKRKSVNYLR